MLCDESMKYSVSGRVISWYTPANLWSNISCSLDCNSCTKPEKAQGKMILLPYIKINILYIILNHILSIIGIYLCTKANYVLKNKLHTTCIKRGLRKKKYTRFLAFTKLPLMFLISIKRQTCTATVAVGWQLIAVVL